MGEDIKVTQKIEAVDEQRYRGALVRARAEDAAAGEAPLKRALGLEKWRAKKNHIDSVKWDGTITTDLDDIQAACGRPDLI